MTNPNKEQIVLELERYVSRYDSQNQAAKTLKGVSSATVSQMINRNWDLIKDEMFRNVASQIGYNPNRKEIVETRDYKKVTRLLADAQKHHNVFAITGEAGSGKSIALKSYAANHKRAHLLQCNEYWNRKYFLAELLLAMGRDYSGLTVAEMMMEVVRVLKKQDNPLIIMDEADKLSDQVLYFFITIYNQLEDHCGIVLVATDHLDKRIKKGLRLNKKGYKEIYSRIGRKCIELNGVGPSDITQVCAANGVTDRNDIKEIIKDSENDLRRVMRKIHAIKNRKKSK
ncbi:ATP-binding protein [Gramella lutea]|uniref:ATP-binding protein n=1 Tax=Christiangramia lutea TaxID=1607951 RepID=A0A9X1V4E4_9FLAO|nr:AAA family ATPase [Christiangramia lutea]MCH4824267.1 ATP-binding protein [Christiangramia lutea]